MTCSSLAKRALVLTGLCVLLGAAETDGAGLRFDADQALKISQAALGRTIRDHRFIDRRGNAVALGELRGQPLLLSLIYTSCYHSCSTLTKQLDRVVDIAREALGEERFTVLTIGFDTLNDTPERMAAYADAQGIDQPNWRFLSAERTTIERLSAELGFVYFPSPRGFDHTAQLSLLDQKGQVYRQIYTDAGGLSPPALVEPLKQLLYQRRAEAGALGGWIDGVRLLCTVYDPNSGRYTFDYSVFVAALVGLACLGAVGVFVARAWRESGAV